MSLIMTMGDYNRPDPMLSYSPINIGVFKGHDFDIDPEFIMSLGRDAFHGLESEDVYEHVRTFEYLCGFVRREGVPNEIIKLLLFPFCLKDGARKWLYSHPSNTFSSWNDLAQAFLYKYFPPSKTFKFRHDILTFQQGEFESFSESWERFKGLLSACPHHRIPSWLTTLTFFQNLLPYNRDLIIMASRGKFDDLNDKEAYDLIERMARADEDWGFDREVPKESPQARVNPDIHSLLDDLTKKVDSLLLDNVHNIQSQHVSPLPFYSNEFMQVSSSNYMSCGGLGDSLDMCSSYSPQTPLNDYLMSDVGNLHAFDPSCAPPYSPPSNFAPLFFPSQVTPSTNHPTPHHLSSILSSNECEMEVMTFECDYGFIEPNCLLGEKVVEPLCANELECVSFEVDHELLGRELVERMALELEKNNDGKNCEEERVETPLENEKFESFCEEYEIDDEPYDGELIGLTCNNLGADLDENFVLEEVGLELDLDDEVNEEDQVRGVEVYPLDAPILEKFEVCFCVEGESTLPSIGHLDLISLTPLLECVTFDYDCDDLLKEVDLSHEDCLLKMFENGDKITVLGGDMNEVCDDVYDKTWGEFDTFGALTLAYKLFMTHLVPYLCHWSYLLPMMSYDHFVDDWSSSFDKLMRSLVGFLNHQIVLCV